ncbi:hypothetical protein LguiB_000088 [Lonicera macranthoides]
MQSRFVTTATAFNRLLFFSNKSMRRGFASASTGRTADPPVHSGPIYDIEAGGAKKSDLAQEETEHKQRLVPPKLPHASSPRLEHTAVNHPVEPTTQQKRRKSSRNVIEEVSCAGLDGSPWPEEDKDNDMEKQRGEHEEDDKEYFKDHKASPLSMIELADTRKPLQKAMDRTPYSGFADYGERVVVWRPEQIDTAEEALLRAARIWKERAMSGDPDFPPSRVLRELKGHHL